MYIHDKAIDHAIQDFRNHEVISATSTSWILRQPYSDGTGYDSHMWVEIVSLAGGKLLVHGDIFPVVFAYAGKLVTAKDKVYWMGRKRFSSYTFEKAQIGMGFDAVKSWDCALANKMLEKHAQELQVEDRMWQGYKELTPGTWETKQDLYEDICLIDDDPYSHFGDRISTQVYSAWGALNKLVNLWEETDARAKKNG